jgi:hypothetical protein
MEDAAPVPGNSYIRYLTVLTGSFWPFQTVATTAIGRKQSFATARKLQAQLTA